MATVQHHHRSTTKVAKKPFKSKHASKGTLKDRAKGKPLSIQCKKLAYTLLGKIEGNEKGIRRTPHQQVMSKFERRNQAKQKRLHKHHDHVRATNVFGGKDGAPRIVAVIPLCEDIVTASVIRSLNSSVDIQQDVEGPWVRVNMDRFKQNINFVMVERDLLKALDACRMADFVLFVLSATEEVDSVGELILRGIESQGVSNVLVTVQGLEEIELPKKKNQVLGSLKSFISHFFPSVEKIHSCGLRQDALNIIRSICSTTPKGIRWREDRSWMMVEEVRWPSAKARSVGQDATGEVIITGVVRGKGLQADRLVQVGDWGDFQIEKSTAASLEQRQKAKGDSMAVDETLADTILDQPTEEQDDLFELAPEEALMEDAMDTGASLAPTERKGVLLDDHHYFSEDEFDTPERPKRLPKGTSKYQAAWYLADMSDSGSDMEDVDDMEDGSDSLGPARPEDGMEGLDLNGVPEPTEAGPSEYPQSEMFLDPSPDEEAEELAAYRDSRKNEAVEDLEFPDEIELPPNVIARERLARYRGLKSFRTSHWDTDEDAPHEPTEWNRLLEIADFKGAKARILRETLVGGVKPGTRVNIHLRAVPLAFQNAYDPSKPLAVFSLLRHEHKRTAVNCSITLSSEIEEPLKSKAEIIMQCGPRRFIINPLFSQAGNTPNDVHKFERYLHPGRSAIASFIGPLTWGSVPVLFFQNSPTEKGSLSLIGTGTILPPSQSRVIAKRIILTGHPFKIHKKVVTVRYMFFNTEDVAWFKALQLWTKRGRSGFIKESLGTHGYFKANFDGKINPMDAIGVSLYKRVWPRSARVWRPDLNGDGSIEDSAPMLVESAL